MYLKYLFFWKVTPTVSYSDPHFVIVEMTTVQFQKLKK